MSFSANEVTRSLSIPEDTNMSDIEHDTTRQSAPSKSSEEEDNLSRILLRKAMLDIQNDSTLSDKQKAIRMQTLMTKNYVTLSYTKPMEMTLEVGHPLSALDQAKTYHDEVEGILGCKHYQRSCKLQ